MLEKRFIKGSDLRKKWGIEDKEHFFRIIRSAHVEISPFQATEKKVIIEGVEWKRTEGRGAMKWILRPHNPRNFMPVTFSPINYYREGVLIPENFRAFDHDIIQYLDDFYYLLEDVKIVEQNMPEFVPGFRGESSRKMTSSSSCTFKPISTPPGNPWEKKESDGRLQKQIAIKIISEERIEIFTEPGSPPVVRTAVEMGFKGKNQLWLLLNLFAEKEGVVFPQQVDDIKPTVSRLRKHLKELFPDAVGNPIKKYNFTKGYECAFVIFKPNFGDSGMIRSDIADLISEEEISKASIKRQTSEKFDNV